MAEPPFTMSKYASEADLLRDKCAWLQREAAKARGIILNVLAGHRIDRFPAERQMLEECHALLNALRTGDQQ